MGDALLARRQEPVLRDRQLVLEGAVDELGLPDRVIDRGRDDLGRLRRDRAGEVIDAVGLASVTRVLLLAAGVPTASVTKPPPVRSNVVSDVTEMPAPLTPAEQRPALERPRRGDPVGELALTALYEEHRGELLGFLVRMTRDRETAEDLLQETFIKLVTETRAGRLPDNPRAWLYQVGANAAISRSRRGALWTRILPRLLDRDEPDRPEGEALRSERDSELLTALATLKPDTRAALLMGAQGFSGSEIARAIGRSEAATRTLMCRARVALRLTLEAAEGPR